MDNTAVSDLGCACAVVSDLQHQGAKIDGAYGKAVDTFCGVPPCGRLLPFDTTLVLGILATSVCVVMMKLHFFIELVPQICNGMRAHIMYENALKNINNTISIH